MGAGTDHAQSDPFLNGGELFQLLERASAAAESITGQATDSAIYEATTAAFVDSAFHAFVLGVSPDRTSLRVVSLSLTSSMVSALEAFSGQRVDEMRFELALAPSFRRVVEQQVVLMRPVPEACRELFSVEVASKVASILSRGRGAGVGIPLTKGGETLAVLCVAGPIFDAGHAHCVNLLAHVINLRLERVHAAASFDGLRLPAATVSGNPRPVSGAGLGAPNDPPAGPGSVQRSAGAATDPVRSLRPSLRVSAHAGHLLILEDDARILESTGALLEVMGFRVEGTRTGEQAVQAYLRACDSSRPFDIVLFDLSIAGGIGGIEALRLIRAKDPGVRAILLSGSAKQFSPEELASYGFQACLCKPATVDELNRAIEQVLR